MSALRARAGDRPAALRRLRGDLRTPGSQRWPRGAIGAHASDGRALYAYPEIAGYWLQWASARGDVEDAHGESVLAWLASARRSDGSWPARLGCTTAHAAVAHLYDHAILWHGLHCWARCRRSKPASALAAGAWSALARFHDGSAGQWRATLAPAAPRWSGQGGPFLLKALARMRVGAGDLARAARAAIPALVDATLATPHREAHPQLYAIEGLLLLGEVALAQRALAALLQAHGGVAGLREQPGCGPRRRDVLAQLLRLERWLAGAGSASPGAAAALAEELADATDDGGRIAFAPGADHCPTWTALFAEQALALQAGERIGVEALV